jgi:Mn2+/Fe2+ NRAMP family transporter
MALNFIGINPIQALVWAAVINGCLAPPLLFLIMRISNEPAIMGERVNGKAVNWLGWITAATMSAAVVGLIATWV